MSETTIYCPHRGGLKLECETPDACAGGADCRRGSNTQLHQTTANQASASRFRWFENSKLTHNLYWCGLYAGSIHADWPHADTWRAWVSDIDECSLLGVYLTVEEAKQALMAKVWEITDAS